MARPALTEEERSNRRAVLLDAPLHLYRARGSLPTVLDIAKAAGMAKGAVYLWFRTKEEIFAALLDDNYAKLNSGVHPILESLDPIPSVAAGSFV
jgi:AcrR family transcriptional regulator